MPTFNVLITGARAGIGNGLLKSYTARPNTIVIAAIRNEPDSDLAQQMIKEAGQLGEGSSIIAVKYDAAQENSAQQMMNSLRTYHPEIQHLDLVCANAGLATHWGPCTTVTIKDLQEHYQVNTIAPISLYQETRNLLLASPGTPKYFYISSLVGSVQFGPTTDFDVPAYGTSKAAGNWFARKANFEEDRIVVAPVSPGWVLTAMGRYGAEKMQQGMPPLTIEMSATSLVNIFDGATKASTKEGPFLDVAGDNLPW